MVLEVVRFHLIEQKKNTMNFEDITQNDLLLPSVEVIAAINEKAVSLGLNRIDRSCIDCIRRKYFEIRVEIDPPTIITDEEGNEYVANFKIAGDAGFGMIARNSSEEILTRCCLSLAFWS